ncbi:MAG: hypothetical protein WC613_01145 [Candidatus Aenigmatarchaeota archaeon]
MDEEKLYEYIKDRQVLEIFTTLCHELEMLEPNGATIHIRRGLQQGFSSRKLMYEAGVYPDGETFSGYRERDERDYAWTIKKIARAITELHLTI